MRLQIATDVAGAISYLHSASSIPIYHRDIKSSNILLDEKYKAKVSDFWASRTIPIDQTHLTTGVKGTFGYVDLDYFRSNQLTEKSDVYSFGVILVELLKGQKSIRSPIYGDERGLIAYFLSSLESLRLSDIVDDRIVRACCEEEAMPFASLARRCLRLKGKEWHAMKEVVTVLEGIKSGRSDENMAYENSGEGVVVVDEASEEVAAPFLVRFPWIWDLLGHLVDILYSSTQVKVSNKSTHFKVQCMEEIDVSSLTLSSLN